MPEAGGWWRVGGRKGRVTQVARLRWEDGGTLKQAVPGLFDYITTACCLATLSFAPCTSHFTPSPCNLHLPCIDTPAQHLIPPSILPCPHCSKLLTLLHTIPHLHIPLEHRGQQLLVRLGQHRVATLVGAEHARGHDHGLQRLPTPPATERWGRKDSV